jgi:2-polyprenyl-6-methoxyphenol hydroxylase-like FAD-dependent oxidoreductase
VAANLDSRLETVSATRPLLEHLVRERVRRLAGVTVHEGVRVTELRRDARHRHVICEDAITVETDLVIDASGRGSRLLHWLGQLGVPLSEPLAVDAHSLEQPAGATRRPRRPRCVPGLRPHLPPDGGAPAMLFSPRAILSACRAALHGMPDPVPQPAVLNALAEPRHAG